MENKAEIQNLTEVQAIEKMRVLSGHSSVCLLTTNLSELPLRTRPMLVQLVGDQGNFWFLSSRDSRENEEIESDSRVQLFFANPGESEFMTVYGQATIASDRKKIEEIWRPESVKWFPKGKDDPNITIIKVIPDQAFYWDTDDRSMIPMMNNRSRSNAVQGRLSVKGAPVGRASGRVVFKWSHP
jgi:general stress protein 26